MRLVSQVNVEEMLKKRQKTAAGTTRNPAAVQGNTTEPQAESLAPAMGSVHQTARAETAPGQSPTPYLSIVPIIVVQQVFGFIDELIPVIIRVEIQLISDFVFVELILHL